jgi:hypothetical protein
VHFELPIGYLSDKWAQFSPCKPLAISCCFEIIMNNGCIRHKRYKLHGAFQSLVVYIVKLVGPIGGILPLGLRHVRTLDATPLIGQDVIHQGNIDQAIGSSYAL